MSQPVIPTGDLPRCLWCGHRESNGCAPAICYHLAGDPVDRAGWFRERQAKLDDRTDLDDEREARADRIARVR